MNVAIRVLCICSMGWLLIASCRTLPTNETSEVSADEERLSESEEQLADSPGLPYKPEAARLSMPYVAHRNYSAMNIATDWLVGLREAISDQKNVELKDRGEAHITILRPHEFSQIERVIGSEVIHQTLRDLGVQEFGFRPLCVGSISKRDQSTYYIVVESDAILSARDLLFKEANLETPHEYYPHITLGFTRKDLHHSSKDITTCQYRLDVETS